MIADGAVRDAEVGCDLLVREPVDDPLQNIRLSWRELLPAGWAANRLRHGLNLGWLTGRLLRR